MKPSAPELRLAAARAEELAATSRAQRHRMTQDPNFDRLEWLSLLRREVEQMCESLRLAMRASRAETVTHRRRVS